MGIKRDIKESTCRSCGGDGWYVEPDEKGEPQQIQCSACYGQGKEDDRTWEPIRIRPSGEPENEPFNEVKAVSYNGGLPEKEACRICGAEPCKCMNLAEILKEMMNQHIYQVERNGKIQTRRTTSDALGVARELFPDIRNKKIMPVHKGHVTTIGDITVTEISPFLG